VEGFNASDADLAAFQKILQRIKPERIQLNTAVRPSADRSIRPVPPGKLHAWAERLGPRAEAIADYVGDGRVKSPNGASDIIGLCRRHPSTLADIAAATGLDPGPARSVVERLVADQLISTEQRGGRVYYLVRESS